MLTSGYPPMTPAIEAALEELKQLISDRYPTATFDVQDGTDPWGIFLVVSIDVDDTFEVNDLVGDRVLDMQVEEGLPIYVLSERPVERTLAEIRAQEATASLLPSPS